MDSIEGSGELVDHIFLYCPITLGLCVCVCVCIDTHTHMV